MSDARDARWFDEGVRFSCNRCGSCCSGPRGEVAFTPAEHAAMARSLGLLPFEFLARFAEPRDGRVSLRQLEIAPGVFDCALLERDPANGTTRCTVHAARPAQCRTWPFWPAHLGSRAEFESLGRTCVGVANGARGVGELHARATIVAAAAATPPGITGHQPAPDEPDRGGNGFSS